MNQTVSFKAHKGLLIFLFLLFCLLGITAFSVRTKAANRDIVYQTVDGVTGWYLVEDGEVLYETTVAKNDYGWWYVKNGMVDFSYNGFARNEYGWWYVENGQVTFGKNDILKGVANTDASAAGEDAWWYIKNSKVTNAETVAQNMYGWWYVRGGKVDFSYTGVKNNDYGWWRIENGKVNFNFKGFANNDYGWWYLEDGRVSFAVNDILKGAANTEASAAGQDGWWYIKNSKVTNEETVAQNVYGWWYVRGGKVDFSYTGVKSNDYGWWRIENGKVNFNYNGFANNEYGWWYLEKGKVTLKTNGIFEGVANTEASAAGQKAWWYVKNSKVTKTTTIAQKDDRWLYVRDGKVDFSFNGFAQNENGWWYVEKGEVTFDRDDILQGTLVNPATKTEETAWWYIKGSKVDFSYTGLGDNAYGRWYVKDGKVDFSVTGLCEYNDEWYFVREGRVDWDYTAIVYDPNSGEYYDIQSGMLAGTWWTVEDAYAAVDRCRKTAGLATLVQDPVLEATARERAKEQWIQYYSNGKATHDRPDGSSWKTAYPDGYVPVGENLAWGYFSGESVVKDWAENGKGYSGQDYRENLLSKEATKVGIACYEKDGYTCWVMCLAK